MDIKRTLNKQRSDLDQSWAGLSDSIQSDPDRTSRLLEALKRQPHDLQSIRDLPDEDLSLICALAFLGLQEGLLHAANAAGDSR